MGLETDRQVEIDWGLQLQLYFNLPVLVRVRVCTHRIYFFLQLETSEFMKSGNNLRIFLHSSPLEPVCFVVS